MSLTLKDLLVVCVSMLLFASACKGPEGPAGINGTNGVDGTPGMKVHYMSVKKAGWKVVKDKKGNWNYIADLPEITEEIMQSGTVLCYRMSKLKTWTQLPISTIIRREGVEDDYFQELWFSYKLGKVYYHWYDSHMDNPKAPPFDMNFKLVVLKNPLTEK